MKIDTEIGRVTKPGTNIFLELGFAPEEAKRLRAVSRKQIDETRLLEEQQMMEAFSQSTDNLTLWDALLPREHSD